MSKNISSAVTKAIAKVSSDIIQKTKLSQDQSQIISVKNVHGDVRVSGNTFNQKATVNMKSLLDALSKEESQQKILMELIQQAKSITSGINIAQYADAQNIMNTLIEETVNLLTKITQTCAVFETQYQKINIKRVHGNVYVNDNVFDEIYNVLQNCSEKAIADSEAIQTITDKISQSASSKSEGFSGWIIVAIVAIVIGTPIIGVVIGGSIFLKFIFPIMLIIGSILLVLYYTNVNATEEMKFVGFSNSIDQTPSCLSTKIKDIIKKTNNNLTAIDVSNICLKNTNCKAFDIKFDNKSPIANFYSNVSDTCIKNVNPDNSTLLRKPKMLEGPDNPDELTTAKRDSKYGDLYLNTTNGTWYQQTSKNLWKLMGIITSSEFNKISWGEVIPTYIDSKDNNNVYVYRHSDLFLYFDVYRNHNGIWQLEHKIKGPGLVAAVPSNINTSGFKQLKRPEWMLYSGLICTVVGVAGTALTFFKK